MSMSSKKTQKESWFKGLDREFKKIVWPDKMTVAKETEIGRASCRERV